MHRKFSLKVGALITLLLLNMTEALGHSREPTMRLREARNIGVENLPLESSIGLTFSESTMTFIVRLVSQPTNERPVAEELRFYDFYGDLVGTVKGPIAIEEPANVGNQTSNFRLSDLAVDEALALAFNPADGHLYVLGSEAKTLFKITETGAQLAAYELAQIGLIDPQAMLFAPSGDLTDEAERQSLYVADRVNDSEGRIVELAFRAGVMNLATQASTTAFLVQTIMSSQFDPPSPDTAGLAYVSDRQLLVMSDSEVNEMPIYAGANIFISSLPGQLTGTFNTLAFSNEPAGAAYNPDGQRMYFSDDNVDEVFELRAGADGLYGTGDDLLRSFDTRAFNSHDPEGIAYDGLAGRMFVADGVNAEVYVVSSSSGDLFDGSEHNVTQFDTEDLGVLDPEGIEFNPDTGILYVVGDPEEFVLEVTTDGQFVQFIDISAAEARKPAGLAYGLRSNNPAYMSLFVAERGVDNDSNPNENDGKVYELGLEITSNPPTSTPTPTNTPTPTSTPSAISTPTPSPTLTETQTAETSTPVPTEEPTARFTIYIAYIAGSS